MENKEVILTDDELNKVVNTLSENRNETDTLLERIEKEHENDDNSNAPLEEGEGMYVSDGTIIGVDEASTNDFSSFDAIDLDLGKLTEENLTATITEAYDMTEEEALKFVSVISRVRNKEKFAIYNELPQKIKSQILSAAMESGVPQNQMPMYLQSMSKMIIEELVHDTEMDALSIDLEKAMKELIPSPLEMYSETNKEYIENEFPKVAESIKDKDPKKAENLLAMRQGFIDAYTFEPMYNILKNNKILKILKEQKLFGLEFLMTI